MHMEVRRQRIHTNDVHAHAHGSKEAGILTIAHTPITHAPLRSLCVHTGRIGLPAFRRGAGHARPAPM